MGRGTRDNKSIDDIMQMSLSAIKSYIYKAETMIKQNRSMAKTVEYQIKTSQDEAEKHFLRRRYNKYMESVSWYEEQLPKYHKVYEYMQENDITNEDRYSYLNRNLKYKQYLAYTDEAVRAAMAEGEYEALGYTAKEYEAVIAISPYLGNRAKYEHFFTIHNDLELIRELAYRKMKVSEEEASEISAEIARLEAEVTDLRSKYSAVVANSGEKNKINEYELMEYLYRFERHVLFNHGNDLGNVKEVRYADGVIWLLIDVAEMADPGLKKHMTSACMRCYLPIEHALVWKDKSIPEGYVLWCRERASETLFRMKWKHLLMSHTYANIWFRVRSELFGTKKKKQGISVYEKDWWRPVDINNMEQCRPKIQSVRDL